MSDELTHVGESGEARMVDVSAKPETQRVARASGLIRMRPATLKAVVNAEVKKGDVLGVARIAGIMAAKRTADLIPLCHPIPISKVAVDLTIPRSGGENQDSQAAAERAHTVEIEATVSCEGKTGVEMEALTAASTAALTVYDMCKAVDKGK